jgi:hypothetical protein
VRKTVGLPRTVIRQCSVCPRNQSPIPILSLAQVRIVFCLKPHASSTVNASRTWWFVARVPAPDLEQLVLDAVRTHLRSLELPIDGVDRDLIERHVDRVIIGPQAVEVRLTPSEAKEPPELRGDELHASAPNCTPLMLPWEAPAFVAVKGIVHMPTTAPAMAPEAREDSSLRLKLRQYQLLRVWLGRKDSNPGMAESNCLTAWLGPKARRTILAQAGQINRRATDPAAHHSLRPPRPTTKAASRT